MPYSQAGYVVAFVPFANGAPSGPWEVFADNFAGIDPIPNTSDAAARPMGLAQGPDGSLYVSDSVKGKIWRVMFKGDRARVRQRAAGAHGDAQDRAGALCATRTSRTTCSAREVLDAGAQLYQTYCVACHQRDGKGDGARFPPLAATRLGLRQSEARLIAVVLHGLQGEIQVEGQTFNGVMPPNAFLTDEQVAQLLTYLRQNFGNYAAGIKPGDVAEVRANPPTPCAAGLRALKHRPARRHGPTCTTPTAQSGPWPHGPVIANVMPGVWMLVNSQRPSGL